MEKLFKHTLNKLNRINRPCFTMRFRLVIFLILQVFIMLTSIIVILFITGTFSAGRNESKKIIHSELKHSSEEISERYGILSVQAVEFSEKLSRRLEEYLDENNLTFDNLRTNPEEIERLLAQVYELTFHSLQLSSCSGAFLILDTTVNPELESSNYSRAGLYIKNMEPNIINSSSPTITLLRGNAKIGRKNSIDLHTQWCLEFDIKDADYYTLPMEAAQKHKADLPLSKLYYWTSPLLLPGTSEEVMLCSIPIIDSNNKILGVCGFEISAMLFKLSHIPNSTNIYSRIFCLMTPMAIDSNYIEVNHSLVAGDYTLKKTSSVNARLQITENQDSFTIYSNQNNDEYLGYHVPIKLYPSESPFQDTRWTIAVMVPKKDISASITRLNIIYITLFAFLISLGIVVSITFSNKYIKPISEGIEIIKSGEPEEAPKTNIQEIDELIDYLADYKKELNKKMEQDTYQISLLEEFADRTKTLSPAERNVFNLYIQGYSAKEIADQLFLSINTIKTHNKHIFSKLNVASREELILYINMLKEIGKEL